MKLISLEDLAPYMGEVVDESPHVRPASEYCQDLIDMISGVGITQGARLPWGKAEFLIQFRPGEVSLWLGINGHGKSLALGQITTSFMAQGERVCIISLEMKPKTTLLRMCKQAAMTGEPSIQFVKNFSEWTNDRLWMYDQQGTVKYSRILAVCRYFADQLQGNHIVIDSLMKCGMDEDDYNGQKRFVDELTAIARDKKIHIHLICHSRKLGDENTPPGKMDLKGSGAITDQADNCITVWRNKKKEALAAQGKEDEKDPDSLMIVDKQRNGEWEGRIALWFHKASQQYVANPSGHPTDLMDCQR